MNASCTGALGIGNYYNNLVRQGFRQNGHTRTSFDVVVSLSEWKLCSDLNDIMFIGLDYYTNSKTVFVTPFKQHLEEVSHPY